MASPKRPAEVIEEAPGAPTKRAKPAYTAEQYAAFQDKALEIINEMYDAHTALFDDDVESAEMLYADLGRLRDFLWQPPTNLTLPPRSKQSGCSCLFGETLVDEPSDEEEDEEEDED